MAGKFVTVSEPADNVRVVVFRKNGKSKNKRSRGTKQVEQAVRSLVDTNGTLMNTYVIKHKGSNRKTRDGWVKDMPINVFKANKKGFKKIKPLKILGF